ncbi:Gfo/Idh/MocA family oxidoreductase [Actinomadura sp. 6N118]|uniref:Gfo/Idh/MocA family protein n=1 Tax=Actinomadura sp. 6N118 TaxID=3375151 RepID=UPI0037B53A97
MRIGLIGAGRIGAFHSATLIRLPAVEELVVADVDPARARALADRLTGATAARSVDALFDRGPRGHGLDGLVVAAATDAHAELVTRAVSAGLPVFCEKPIAVDISGTLDVLAEVRRTGVPVQVGFQRRFDAGHVAAREAVASGRLGWVHTLRSCTLDPAPPPREYVPHSGGLFRDCVIHDVDAVRFVTGQEVMEVIAVGANKGDAYFREFRDVDTAAAVLTLKDGTLALSSATRYNAAGYDVRLEVLGSQDSIIAGLDGRTPLTRLPSADAEGSAAGAAHTDDAHRRAAAYGGFLERFADAYAAELAAFTQVVAGRMETPCPPEDALEAFYVAEACEMSRREGRSVLVKEVRS